MADITFFCSPIGLGHATRDSAVGEFFRNSVSFVTGSDAAKLLSCNGFDVINEYNPPQFTIKDGRLQNSLKWLWRYYNYYKECKDISKRIIEKTSPKIIVSDEDFASLTIAQDRKIPNILITDILETRFTSGLGHIIEKKMNRSMSDIIKRSDMVIIPEEGDDDDNIRRVGPIVRQIKESRQKLREKFDFRKKTILVSIGGTDAGLFLVDKVIELIPKISNNVDIIFVTGPSLEKKIANARTLGFVENLHEYIFAADVIVSLAGKSTIDEAKAYGTPGIFIPIKDHFEQEDNARMEGYEFDDVFRLEKLVEEKLNENRDPVRAEGATKACELIRSLIESNP